MKSLLLTVIALTWLTLAHTLPCFDDSCGGEEYMGPPSGGAQYGNYENGQNGGSGGQSVDNGGSSNRGGGEYHGGGGGSGGGGGGGPPQRNNYCPTCYVQNFGNGKRNHNKITIKRHRVGY